MVDRGGTTQRLSGTSAAVALALVLLVAGCKAQSSPERPTPSPTEASSIPSAIATSSTVEPSATAPAPGFEAPAGVLPPRSRAVVRFKGLRVREAPGLAAKVMDTLPAGTIVELGGSWGPIEVDGTTWYQVLYGLDLASGFVAGGSETERYLDLLPPRCETAEPDLAALQLLTDWERLACYGDRSLTVTGTYGCPVCGSEIDGTFEPLWLATPNSLAWLGWPRAVIVFHTPPGAGLPAPPNASIIRATGHFSDPLSTTCVIRDAPGQQGVAVDPVMAELYCREHFVLDDYEVIGTNPKFDPSIAPSG